MVPGQVLRQRRKNPLTVSGPPIFQHFLPDTLTHMPIAHVLEIPSRKALHIGKGVKQIAGQPIQHGYVS